MLSLAAGLLILIFGRSPGLRGPAARLAAIFCIAAGLVLSPFLFPASALLMGLLSLKGLAIVGLAIGFSVQVLSFAAVLGLATLVLRKSFLNV